MLKIFLCGDVMLGRGIDQALPQPCSPRLHEAYMESATGYLRLAEERNGPIPLPLDFAYVWGATLEELNRAQPDARIINLETSITRSDAYESKGINYRMSPENAHCLAAAGIDCCVLANNHVLDWGRDGLLDTLSTLRTLHIQTAGAGRDLAQASVPAILQIPGKRRLLVFSFACLTSGTPRRWAARPDAAGVNLLPTLTEASVTAVARQVAEASRPGDIVIVSIHWGPNWGYEVSEDQRWFARALIDRAGVSIVHGHSSHHAKAVEIYGNRLILYGCGDFLNDYEGIRGYEEFRDDLAVMYLATIDPTTGWLGGLEMVPFQIRRFQLVRPSGADMIWLRQTLDRESRRFGTAVMPSPEGHFSVSRPDERVGPPY
jgi:poly-gamma-glutamate capsule biosynthesis protein CapA/YwtB (metallophosphatase superfamily)